VSKIEVRMKQFDVDQIKGFNSAQVDIGAFMEEVLMASGENENIVIYEFIYQERSRNHGPRLLIIFGWRVDDRQ